MKILEEPLELSAPIAWRLAPSLCHKDPQTGEDCSWNHRLWQHLRLMGLVTSPSYHIDFYRRAFESVTAIHGAPRVLISGAADYGMLACLVDIFGKKGIRPEITMIDVCETPLELSRWYAERVSCRIETFRSDVLAFQSSKTFDAVCSDSFLGRFFPAEQVDLLKKWRELLRPGGLAITVNRLRPGSSGERVGFNADQARAFCATVLRNAESLPEPLKVDMQELRTLAERYADKHFTYSIESARDVQDLFERAGFALETMLEGSVTAGNRQSASGPSVRSDAVYAKVIATRM